MRCARGAGHDPPDRRERGHAASYHYAEDMALEEELRTDPKELAEHLMLLDLGRNDVGRVAKIGSVRSHGKDDRGAVSAT